uniref:Uncharacterized protein n=1 Tax=Knipowitschia caucasica TaxID=637954 RepID=A0AAV2KA83_KNICA
MLSSLLLPLLFQRKRVRYSELDFEKVMHTRKRHSELYHELNHSSKFHTIGRYSRDPAMSTFKFESSKTVGRTRGVHFNEGKLNHAFPACTCPPPSSTQR